MTEPGATTKRTRREPPTFRDDELVEADFKWTTFAEMKAELGEKHAAAVLRAVRRRRQKAVPASSFNLDDIKTARFFLGIPPAPTASDKNWGVKAPKALRVFRAYFLGSPARLRAISGYMKTAEARLLKNGSQTGPNGHHHTHAQGAQVDEQDDQTDANHLTD